ncbi:MAG: NosD domain-containing protein [Promethearchaeota archaeon]
MSKKRFIILCLMVVLFLSCNFTLNMVNFENKMIFQKELCLKSSGYWVLNSIIIDDTGGGDYLWITAAAEDWCSGSGTWSNPYVIENVTFNANNAGSGLLIRNSNKYFIVRNCTFHNSGSFTGEYNDAGLSLNNTKNGKLIDNECSFNNGYGISLDWNSDNNTVEGNILKNNSIDGAILRYSYNITFSRNTAIFNVGTGITTLGANNSKIFQNTAIYNQAGICIASGSKNITVSDNIIRHNTIEGLYLRVGSTNNTFKNNLISYNGLGNGYGIGLRMDGTTFNKILNNDIKDNRNGIEMLTYDNNHHNIIFNNEIEDNALYGLSIQSGSNDNLIYGNLFMNSPNNALDNGANNSWDNGVLGNCWDDYNGTGPYIIWGIAGSQDNFPMFNNYNIPGDIGIIPLNQTIKIGLVNDMNHITGKDTLKGANLAAKEVNEAGGVLINGSIFYIGLTSHNTFEYEIPLNINNGVNAVYNMISNYNPDFIIGGTQYDAVNAYTETIMDAKIPFISTGCSLNTLTQNVIDNYNRYKYFFRAMINASQIFTELMNFQAYLTNYLSSPSILNRPINKIAFLYEDLYYYSNLMNTLKTYLPMVGIEIVKEIKYDSSTSKSEFEQYWNEIDNAGAQLTLVGSFFSDKVKIISETYGEIKPRCLLFSTYYNSTKEYWDGSNGKCQYEISYQSIYNISRTSLTKPFWNNFVNEYDHEPTFHSASAYNAIYLIVNATKDSQSWSADKIVDSLEKINSSNSFPGVCGYIAFTSSHGIYNALGYGSGLMCQWQSGGTKVVIPNGNLIYPDSLATGSLETPDWGINIRFTINSPSKNNVFAEFSPDFNIEILDAVDKIWYTLNSGSEKYFITNNETIDQTAWMALSDGVVKITFYSNETSGEIYRRFVHVIKDTEPPQVTIEPMDTTTFGSEAPTIILNIQDTSNITESYYSLDGGVTKIPFTGNEVTINQTLWDVLGEGIVTISFYIIDSVGKETIVYVDVYKDLPGDDFLLYIIIGVIALGLGVVSTIVYTQYRRKKRRRTEWIKLKKKKGLISPELAEGKNLIFISYATTDSDLFQIPLITDILVQYPEIDDILYWESDMHDDIYEYMDDNLKLCSVFLLFCSQNSLYSEPVKMEWRSALKLDKKIIPIFINPNDIPPLLTTKLGVQFNESEVYDSIEAIYQMLLKKLEIVSTREFCKYLIPKMVSDQYFEEKTAVMVKKDIEIESDNTIDDLQIQFISILEKNNFQFLKKPIEIEEIEKSESHLISLRFFAEDKFEKLEIGLTATIQKVEDYKNKIYLRVMGNREWMVNEILSDLANKSYPLKTVTELLREYSEKIDNFIDHIDNLEEFLRKNLGPEIEEIEETIYQYLSKQIEKDDFIKKGLQILGKRFILVFIENLPKILHEKEELEDKGKEIDIQL